jgi:hypothetical protein
MLERIKQHPYLFGGVAIGAVILFFMLHNSGGSTATDASGSATGDVAAAEAYQQAQLQAQTQMAQVSAAANASSEQTAASLHIADLQAMRRNLPRTSAVSKSPQLCKS